MSAVNHDAPAVIGQLVPEAAMNKQQQDAARPSVAATAAHIPPAAKIAPPAKETSVFHQLSTMVLVTLDLSQDFMLGLKSELSGVETSEESLNLYSPFRKAPKPKGDVVFPAGVLRSALSEIFDITDELNNSKILILGKPGEAILSIDKAVKATRGQIEALMPLTADTVLATITESPEEGEEPEEEDGEGAGETPEAAGFDITFGKIVRTTSWVNTPRTSGQQHEIETIAKHNAVINLTVNAGALYDSEEPVKYISQVETVLRLIQAKRTEAGTPGETGVLLAVLLNPSDLAEKSNREMLDALIDDVGFTLYTRSELYEPEQNSWTPSTKAEVERELLTARGDMLLVKSLDADEDEGDGDDVGDGAAAE